MLNECGDSVYAPIAPCTSHVNLQNNNQSYVHDPVYNHKLYLDNIAALLSDASKSLQSKYNTKYW